MSDLWLLLSVSFLVLILLILIMLMVVLLVRSQSRSQTLLVQGQELGTILLNSLLRDQRMENQILRNQLRAQDVPTLLGLNHATLPSDVTASNEQGSEPINLGEALEYEEEMAKRGYKLGDVSDEFDSAGWSAPIVRNDGSSDPVAFDFN